MEIQMRVHRVSTHHVERTVIHEGEEARAMVAELEVELTDGGDGGHGSQMLHFRSKAKIEEAKDVFAQGGMVALSFVKSAPPPAPEPTPDAPTEGA
jgi:dihydroxyacetone kinase